MEKVNMTEIMERLIESTRRANEAEDDVFIGGVRCCGKCHTPKEKMIEHDGKFYLCSITCKCELEKAVKEKEEAARKKRMEIVIRRRQEGFPDQDMMRWTFATDDGSNPRMTGLMKRYVENFEEFKKTGYGLILYGPVGTGKTFAAAEVVNALIEAGYPCLMTNFTRISQVLWSAEEKQAYMDSLNAFDLIVLDDLATENNSEYMKSIIFQIIDSRYRAGLPMIVTTNIDPVQASGESLLNRRLYDRLQERCMLVKVEGDNKRSKIGKANAEAARKLLGV